MLNCRVSVLTPLVRAGLALVYPTEEGNATVRFQKMGRL